MKKIFVAFLLMIFLFPLISSAITSIDYPYNNDTLSYTSRINLQVNSAGSSNCYFNYDNVHNVSIACSGGLVDLPNADGTYMIYVGDDAGSQKNIQVHIVKPSGILIAFLYALVIIFVLGMLFIFVINLAKLATFSTTVYSVAISWSFFFGMLLTYQLILEYSAVPNIINLLDQIRSISMWIAVVFPLIALVVTMFKKGTDKRKPISIEDLTGGNLLRRY